VGDGAMSVKRERGFTFALFVEAFYIGGPHGSCAPGRIDILFSRRVRLHDVCLGARAYRRSRFNFFAIFTGFALQTAFLYQRGQALGRCPLTNLFEVFIFLSWSVVLLYLVVGPAYRLSLLGAFTSPLVFVFQVFALLAPIDAPAKTKIAPNPWLELHAVAFSLTIDSVAGSRPAVDIKATIRSSTGRILGRACSKNHAYFS
jgi:hypothetical protein